MAQAGQTACGKGPKGKEDMKAVIQRVTGASVEVDGKVVGRIASGLVVLLGVAKGDGESDGSVLLISQFTLLGRTTNGRRPSFDEAAPPDVARRLYERVAADLRAQGVTVETGVFAAHMTVTLVNDGPVTFTLDSREGRS
jgi:D-tyrosyl-tRNA(Tyr) deacylase